MKINKRKKTKKKRVYSDTLIEIIFEMILEIIWNVILFLPRMVARLISNIW
ncbi:hypothetical protein [Ureibacillus sp. FSL E2-3493]|uniref:hypothetical protein n=1 Tax=Ureibacillus sp. FSL E2-3493 TaxID=2921367 RepID=UPI00311A5640